MSGENGICVAEGDPGSAARGTDAVEMELRTLDDRQCREIRLLPEGFGRLFSSIAIYENKVLILNLHQNAFAILMENAEVAESLSMLFRVLWATVKPQDDDTIPRCPSQKS